MSLYLVDFVTASDMRSNEREGGFYTETTKKKDTKVFQKAEKVFAEADVIKHFGHVHEP